MNNSLAGIRMQNFIVQIQGCFNTSVEKDKEFHSTLGHDYFNENIK